MMEEKKYILLKTYQEYHFNNDVGIKEELLIEQAKEFLSSPSVRPKDRFIYLHIDFYKNVLENIASNFEKNEESIERMKTGFNSLEMYAINLWRFPWRKEYHSIKLYTAFFKHNVEVQLQNKDAIFSILTSLGYKKTERDRVTVQEQDIDRAKWVALDLFLVQVDLQIIMKIMETFNDSNLPLKDIVKARAKTHDVKSACEHLFAKIAKRQKLEEPQESDTASHRQVKETFGGRINTMQADVRGTSAVQSTSADSILSNTTEAIAMDIDNSSTSSAGKRRDPFVDAPIDYKTDRIRLYDPAQYRDVSERDLYGFGTEQGYSDAVNPVQYGGLFYRESDHVDPTGSDLHKASASTQTRHRHSGVTKGMMDASVGGSRSLSYSVNETPTYFSQPYHTQGHAHFTGGDLQGINVTTQSNALRPETRVMADKSTATALRQLQGSSVSTEGHTHLTEVGSKSGVRRLRQVQSSSGTDKYDNLREVSSSSNQQSGSNNFLQPARKQETVTHPNDPSAVVGQRRVSATEPMDMEHQYNLSSRHEELTERVFARVKSQSGVSDLKVSLQNHLTLENGTPKEASKQSAIEAASSKVGTTRVAYISGREDTGAPHPFQSVASAGYDTSARTADGRGYSLYKKEEKGLSDELLPKRNTQSNGVHAEEVRENKRITSFSIPPRFSQDQSKSDQASQKERLKKDRHSEEVRNDLAHGAAVSLSKKDHHSGGARSDPVYGAAAVPVMRDHHSEGAKNDPAYGAAASLSKKDHHSGSARSDPAYGSAASLSKKDHHSGGARSDPAYGAAASLSKKDHHSGGARRDPVYGAAALPAKKDHHSEGARGDYEPAASLCSQCRKQGELICTNCMEVICISCKGIYTTNLCEQTKKEHVFTKLKRYTSHNHQRAIPVDEGMEKEWSCSKCTFLNHPDHGICVMCGATRGVSDVEQSKPGSTVCRNCTLLNKEGTKVCVACDKTLDHNETFV